jgi:hypothetical protein
LNKRLIKKGQVAIIPGNNKTRTFFFVAVINGSICGALNRNNIPKRTPIKKYTPKMVKNILMIVII